VRKPRACAFHSRLSVKVPADRQRLVAELRRTLGRPARPKALRKTEAAQLLSRRGLSRGELRRSWQSADCGREQTLRPSPETGMEQSRRSCRGNGCANVSLTFECTEARSHAFGVCNDSGRNVGCGKFSRRPDDQRSPGCGTCAERSRHWRSGLGPNAWDALAGGGHANALTVDQQHALTKQRRPLSVHPCSTQSGAERRDAQHDLAGADTARRSFAGTGADGCSTERRGQRPKSSRKRHGRLHEIVGPRDARRQTGLGASVRAQSSGPQKAGVVREGRHRLKLPRRGSRRR